MFDLSKKKAFVCDLDGTLFMGADPIPSAVKFVIDSTKIGIMCGKRTVRRTDAKVDEEKDAERKGSGNPPRLMKAVSRAKWAEAEVEWLCQLVFTRLKYAEK